MIDPHMAYLMRWFEDMANDVPEYPDYSQMNDEELMQEVLQQWENLKIIYRAELSLPCPDPGILQTAAEQIQRLEELLFPGPRAEGGAA